MRALRIQRLEGSRPTTERGLWVLYVVELVMGARENAVAVCAPQLEREIIQIRAAVSWWVEAEGKMDSISWSR